jgi:hypothetical protein
VASSGKPRRVGVFVTLALVAVVFALHAVRTKQQARQGLDDGYRLLVRAERTAGADRVHALQQAEESFVRSAGLLWLDATALAAASLVPGLRVHLGEVAPALPAEVTRLTEAEAIGHGRALLERAQVDEFLRFLRHAEHHARALLPLEMVARNWLAARTRPSPITPWRQRPAAPGG